MRVPRFPGPCYLTAEGDERGVYVRLGSTSRRASPQQREALAQMAKRVSYDQQPCLGADLDDLDRTAAAEAFAQVGREVTPEALESLGVIVRFDGERVLSNGGVLLFDTPVARRRYFPDAGIRCARFAGTEKVNFLDQQDLEGPLHSLVEEALRFVRRNTRTAARVPGLLREETPEYPVVALREALVNAVAHADYSLTGMAVRVAIFDDRLEVETPGGWPLGASEEDLKAGISRIRNPVIARVLHELRLMERWGSGYRRIREACDAGGYPIRTWHEVGTVLRTRFEPHPAVATGTPTSDVGVNVGVDVSLNERQRWFPAQLRQGLRVTADEVAEHFGVARRTVERDIAALREAGVVQFVGAPKTGRYEIVEQP